MAVCGGVVPARQRRSISSNPVTLAWPERYILAPLLGAGTRFQ